MTFGTGLCVGGMIRPSVVIGALSPAAVDLTLWVLFTSALAVTFLLYRVAVCRGVRAASAITDKMVAPLDPAVSCGTKWTAVAKTWAAEQIGGVDRKLICGEVLFGVGWGLSGFCPGPLLVGLAGAPQLLPAIVFGGMGLGFVIAKPVEERLCSLL